MDKMFNMRIEKLKTEIQKSMREKTVTEIRLRAGFCPVLYGEGKKTEIKSIVLSFKDIEDIFLKVCGYTVSACERRLKEGYVTLPGGHRVGIGGRFSYDGDGYIPAEVTSLTVRIAQNPKVSLPPGITDFKKGLIVAGPPHSGKTTLLKNLCSRFSDLNIVICDERNELYTGTTNCDFLSGINKVQAIWQAVRVHNPDMIICDEIGDERESERILSRVNSGTEFVCTAHCSGFEDLLRKPNIKLLMDAGVFDKAAILKKDFSAEVRDV